MHALLIHHALRKFLPFEDSSSKVRDIQPLALLANQRPALRLARYIPTIGRGSGTFEGDINVEEILMVSLCSYITANHEWLRVRQFCRH